MVVALGPGKFYGSGLPRPRFYTDVKFSSERVDPPVPVMDPFLQWAHEAHWSMGGLSFRRLRLQGRIEGSVKKLRADQEKKDKKRKKARLTSPSSALKKIDDVEIGSDSDSSESEPEAEVPRPVPSRTRSQKATLTSPSPSLKKKAGSGSDPSNKAVRVLSRTQSQKKQATFASAKGNAGSASGSDKEPEVALLMSRRKRKLMDEFEKVAAEKGLSGKAGRFSDRTRVQRSDPVIRRASPRKKSPVV